jgi:hypothetical protein
MGNIKPIGIADTKQWLALSSLVWQAQWYLPELMRGRLAEKN